MRLVGSFCDRSDQKSHGKRVREVFCVTKVHFILEWRTKEPEEAAVADWLFNWTSALGNYPGSFVLFSPSGFSWLLFSCLLRVRVDDTSTHWYRPISNQLAHVTNVDKSLGTDKREMINCNHITIPSTCSKLQFCQTLLIQFSTGKNSRGL